MLPSYRRQQGLPFSKSASQAAQGAKARDAFLRRPTTRLVNPLCGAWHSALTAVNATRPFTWSEVRTSYTRKPSLVFSSSYQTRFLRQSTEFCYHTTCFHTVAMTTQQPTNVSPHESTRRGRAFGMPMTILLLLMETSSSSDGLT
jgi:hypothetical protein